MADQENKVVWQHPEAGTIVPVASRVDFHVVLPWPDDYLIYPPLLEGLFGDGLFDTAAVIETNAGLPAGSADGTGGGTFITGNRALTAFGRVDATGWQRLNYWMLTQSTPPTITRGAGVGASAGNGYRGVVYAGGSFAVAIPHTSTFGFHRLNIQTNAGNLLASAAGTLTHAGGVYVGNGKVVAIPYNAQQFCIIDTIENTATYVGPSLGAQTGKFYGGIYIGNGRLVAIPHNAPQPVIFDVNELTVTPFGDVDESSMKYAGGIYLDHGRVAAIPYNSPYIMHIDTHAQVTRELIQVDIPEYNKYSGGVYIGDERFICMPFDASQFLFVDMKNRTATPFGTPDSRAGKYINGYFAGNGYIVAVSHNIAVETKILDLGAGYRSNVPFAGQALLTAWFNKF